MSRLDYPATLPGPEQARHIPNPGRVHRSSPPGPYNYAIKERDYSGTMELEFFYDATMSAVFFDFWKNSLIEGGMSFNCNWPALKQGGLVVQFITEPTFKHVYNGAYRISVVAQVRGATQPVQFSSDPFFANVTLLLHGNDTPGTNTFTDSSSYHRTPTAVVGAVINNADSTAFGQRSISTFVGSTANYIQYSYAASAASEPFTLEFRYKINQAVGVGVGYGEPAGEFLRLASGSTQAFSANGLINSAVTHLFTATNALAVDWAAFGLSSANDRVNVAFCREAGNVVSVYFNYRYAGNGGYTGAIDNIYIGNRGISSSTTAVSIEEVRYTSGIARYSRGLANIGTRVVPAQVAPFPDSL
jgi:hypothetical protein